MGLSPERVAIYAVAVLASCVVLWALRRRVDRAHEQVQSLTSHLSEAEEQLVRHTADVQESMSDLLISLARRNQALLHHQLARIHDMETSVQDPALLSRLAAIDRLGIRMRRNAESLVILSGRSSAQKLSRPAAVSETIHRAVAETEDSARIEVVVVEDAELIGRAVTDIVHLLAELLENAVTFSPPKTRVTVRSAPAPHGYSITVLDRGTGFSAEALAETNRMFAGPVQKSMRINEMLGFPVVHRLADRHDVTVRLASQPGRGTEVTVEIPHSALVSHLADEQIPASDHLPRTGGLAMSPRLYVPEYPAAP